MIWTKHIRTWVIALAVTSLWLMWTNLLFREKWNSSNIQNLSVYADTLMWQRQVLKSDDFPVVNAFSWLLQTDHELEMWLQAYQEIESAHGPTQSTLEHATILHAMSEEETDAAAREAMKTELAHLMASIRNPKSISSFGELAVLVLTGHVLSSSQLADLERMRSQYPKYWTLHYLAAKGGSFFANKALTDSARFQSVARNMTALLCLSLALYVGSLVLSLGWLFRCPRDRTNEHSRRFHRLWKPSAVLLCISGGSLFAWIIIPAAGQVAANITTNPYGWYLLDFIFKGGLVAFPIVWLVHCFVRRVRFAGCALGFKKHDFADSAIWIDAFQYFGVFVTAAMVLQYLFLGLGLRPDAADTASRTFWAYGVLALPLSVIWSAILAPLVEETIFRGFLFSSLRAAWGARAGAVGSSLLFSATHLYSVHGSILVVVMGIMFCWIYHRSGKLGVTILVHGLFNLVWSVEDWLLVG